MDLPFKKEMQRMQKTIMFDGSLPFPSDVVSPHTTEISCGRQLAA
jgi:hypothetical protein